MATADVSYSRRRKHRYEEDRPTRGKKKRSHGFRNFCLLLLLLMGVGGYFAPAIIGYTPLRNVVLQRALQLNGTINVGAASLGWFSPVSAQRIEIFDSTGDTAVSVAEVHTEKSLAGLLMDLNDLGRIEVVQPNVHVVCGDQDTNLEQIFAELLNSKGDDAQVAASLKVIDGTVVIDDVPADRTFRIEKLGIDCTIGGNESPLLLTATGSMPEKRHSGQFKIDLRTAPSPDGKNPLAGGKIDCQTTAIPLEMADPILRRSVSGAKLGGRLSTRLSGGWGSFVEGGDASVRGEALVHELTFASTALGSDQLRLERVEMPCHLVQRGDILKIEQLGLKCELGNLTVTGSAKMADFSATDMAAALARENYQLDGELDLVELARALPETLRIRKGTEITSGNVQLSLASRQKDGDMSWSGQFETSHLGANADGKALVWENPLAMEFAAHETPDGIVVDKAECTSSFLQANATGSMNDLTATAKFDLARLVSELKQFADLSQLQLTGQGEAKLALKRVSGDQFTANGQFQTKGFQFVPVAGGKPWKEDLVTAKFDLGGQFEKQSLKRVDRATFSVEVGSERAVAQLREPIVDPGTSAWPIQCSWRGNLQQWNPRLEACLGMVGWDLRGAGNMQAALLCTGKSFELEHAKVDIAQLQVWGHDWFINEPSATLTMEGKWNVEKGTGEITDAKLVAGSTAATIKKAAFQTSDDGWKLDDGNAEFGADLVTFYRWRHDPRQPVTWRIYGRLASKADLKHDAGVTTAQLDGTIEQLKLVDLTRPANSAGSTWEEPRITLASLASYRHASEQLQLEKCQVAAAALRVDAGGSLPMSAQGGDVDVKGTLQYDWAQLTPLLRACLGDSVQIAGRQARSFAMKGRLSGPPSSADSWRQVTGDAAIGWTAINVYGLDVGQGEIAARLADGRVRTQPIDVQVSDGRFTFAPVVQLVPAPQELQVPKGPLLTNIHLSPEMCKRGLKFVAPIVAETTVAEGRFSVMMDGGRVPLADPSNADLSGHLAIKAQVMPGPVAQEFFLLVNELTSIVRRGGLQPANDQSRSLMSIDTNDVEFRMVNHRVYHRNLKFVVGSLPIVTSGSVGMDETLNMVAEVPIRANLFGRDLSMGQMEGQSLKIPIGGTLNKPKLDKGVLQQLTAQLLQNATKNIIVDEATKQLERLIPFQRQ